MRKTMTIEMHLSLDEMTDDELSSHISRLEELARDARQEEARRGGSCYSDGDEPPYHEHDMTDIEADADTLRSAGMGTDEDYGYFGGDDF